MSRRRFNYTIKIWVTGNDEIVDKLVRSLNNSSELLVGDDYDVYKVDSEIMFMGVKYTGVKMIKGFGWEEGDYDEGCRYTSNGDGWPASFDWDDGDFVEDDLDEFIAKFQQENTDINIIKVGVYP